QRARDLDAGVTGTDLEAMILERPPAEAGPDRERVCQRVLDHRAELAVRAADRARETADRRAIRAWHPQQIGLQEDATRQLEGDLRADAERNHRADGGIERPAFLLGRGRERDIAARLGLTVPGRVTLRIAGRVTLRIAGRVTRIS